MIDLPEQITLPIKTDASGTIRVSGTRITLHSIITLYRAGETPETIHEAFSPVPLADVYAVIAYYLAHREALDAYLAAEDEAAEAIRQQWEASYSPKQRARLDGLRHLLAQKRASEG